MSSVSRRTFLGASAATLLLSRVGRAASTLIRQPYIQRLLVNSTSILWTTPQSSAGSVIIIAPDGTSSSFPAVVTAFPSSVTQMSSTYYQYRADITGLTGGTQYTYQVLVDGQSVAANPLQNTFRTPTTGNFSFLVFGDSGAGSPEEISLVNLMAAESGVSKVIHVGDLAYENGTFAQFEENYFGINASLMSRLPFFTTPGNHEYYTNSAGPYLAVHAMPTCNAVPAAQAGRYYSFDWGDAHFVSVDSNLLVTDAAAQMLAWLDADLAASPKFWNIVFLHHPPYPTGTHLGDPICVAVQQSVTPIVEKYGVPLVLSGHEHGYERSFPLVGGQPVTAAQLSTTYLITGGGGAAMEDVGSLPQTALAVQAFNYLRVDVNGPSLTFSAKGLNGNVIDRVTLNPPPVLIANGVVNAGDSSPAIAPGSLVTIYGRNLAIRVASPSTSQVPTVLAGISVRVNGIAAPVLYASPTQINIQMPFEVSGRVALEVTTPNGTASASVEVAAVAPSILAVVSGSDINSSVNPAAPGGYVSLYMTGLGAPAGTIATGQAAPNGAMPVAASVQVMVGSSVVQPMYAGLAPGFTGVDQVNFQIPAGISSGVYSVRVMAGGVSSVAFPMSIGFVNASSSGAGTGGNTSDKVRTKIMARAAAAGK